MFKKEKNVKKQIIINGGNLNEWMSKPTGQSPLHGDITKSKTDLSMTRLLYFIYVCCQVFSIAFPRQTENASKSVKFSIS